MAITQSLTATHAMPATMAVQYENPLKRTSTVAEFNTPATKRLNRGSIRHHKALWDPQRSQRREGLWQDEESQQSMLTRSIGVALQAVGFEAAAPEAIDAFRSDVEEYMAHYLADVRQSMLSSRRTGPIPQDFLQALHTHQLSLRSLIPHLDPPVPPSLSQFPLQSEAVQDNEQQHLRFLGPILYGATNERAKSNIPKHFPDYPSKHTYKATAEFPEREQDPRKVRERATEEGRLGEEALRRLVSAASNRPAHESQKGQAVKSMRARRDQVFMETMQAVTAGAQDSIDTDSGYGSFEKEKQKEGELTGTSFGNGRLNSAVNSEKRYWRKPALQKRGTNGSI